MLVANATAKPRWVSLLSPSSPTAAPNDMRLVRVCMKWDYSANHRKPQLDSPLKVDRRRGPGGLRRVAEANAASQTGREAGESGGELFRGERLSEEVALALIAPHGAQSLHLADFSMPPLQCRWRSQPCLNLSLMQHARSGCYRSARIAR